MFKMSSAKVIYYAYENSKVAYQYGFRSDYPTLSDDEIDETIKELNVALSSQENSTYIKGFAEAIKARFDDYKQRGLI